MGVSGHTSPFEKGQVLSNIVKETEPQAVMLTNYRRVVTNTLGTPYFKVDSMDISKDKNHRHHNRRLYEGLR